MRNLSDGAVEVHAVGPGGALDEMERRLSEGPSSARVSGVVRIAGDPRTPVHEFLMEEW